ncbi:dephospho-CoA kinase [Enterococcus raffinosus]|uniref:dephospho-CoA kinase n=1 Tax=Enterococcus raffinosus TaxID=71452 RepID=UPI001C125105|nr:dephospho-CoA kinase [Enterococcus raffinosus]MBU5361284.1 dephospho-CoA kinase [Enterococcus raffinosus]
MSFVLGITGGIASGKSTVVDFFKAEGFPVVDGDIVAREVVEPGSDGLRALEKVFGRTILQNDGRLDRKKLGSIIFQNEQKRHLLNKTLDPFIRSEIERQTLEAKKISPLVIVDIPLLFEGHYESMMDEVATVYVTPKIQLERLMARNDLSEEEAIKRINSQLSLEEKKKRADIVFDNCHSQETTRQQVLNWLKRKKFVS